VAYCTALMANDGVFDMKRVNDLVALAIFAIRAFGCTPLHYLSICVCVCVCEQSNVVIKANFACLAVENVVHP